MEHNFKLRDIKPILVIFVFAGTICMPQTLFSQQAPEKKGWVVVIDAGHGGKDPGTIGFSKTKEKNINLAVALKTGKYISEYLKDVKVIYTRDHDTLIGLAERAEIANKNKADLFISIHSNGLDDNRPYGAETYVLGQRGEEANLKVAMKENSVITFEENYESKYEGYDPNSVESFIIFSLMQNTYLKQSTDLASLIQDQFRERVGRHDRGVKQDFFIVQWRSTMPSVLIELGFITNANEEKYLTSEEGQDYLASAIFRAIRDYKNAIDSRTGILSASTAAETREAKEEAVPQEKEPIVSTAATEEKLPSNNTPAEKPEADKHTYFMVQIAALPKSKAPEKVTFRVKREVTRIETGERYKYAAGKFTNYNEAVNYRREISETYPDAFVIAVKDGKIISLKEAMQSK